MPADDFGLVGHTIDQLRFDEVVDGGGFGLVYRATHMGLDEPVAVKCLRIDKNVDEKLTASFFQRFRDETRILYRLSQGTLDIVRGISSGTLRSPKTNEDVPYMVLEWLDGHTLSHELRARVQAGRPYSIEEIMELFAPVFAALAHAHAQGIVHRDVKPGNLFFARSREGKMRIKVLDFGLAKIYEPTLGVTPSVETMKGVALCSPSYGAPEQFVKRFGDIGPWTDVYALALVILELLSLKKARHADTLVEGLGKAIAKETASPTAESLGVFLPPPVSLVLERAVARETRVRPADAGRFERELRDAIAQARAGHARDARRGDMPSAMAATIVKPGAHPDDLKATNVLPPRSAAPNALNATAILPQGMGGVAPPRTSSSSQMAAIRPSSPPGPPNHAPHQAHRAPPHGPGPQSAHGPYAPDPRAHAGQGAQGHAHPAAQAGRRPSHGAMASPFPQRGPDNRPSSGPPQPMLSPLPGPPPPMPATMYGQGGFMRVPPSANGPSSSAGERLSTASAAGPTHPSRNGKTIAVVLAIVAAALIVGAYIAYDKLARHGAIVPASEISEGIV
jgi:serine/threonine protein kinase